MSLRPAGAVTAEALRLVEPSLRQLPQYEAALARGWSPDTERDASAEQLARLRQGRRSFLAGLVRQGGVITLASGEEVERLPCRLFWIDDGEFCGIVDFRYVPGSDSLPEYVPGHIGYAVVPWKRRCGYATHALALVLDVARRQGMRSVQITCNHNNEASRRVILKNGGVFTGIRSRGGETLKHVYRIDLAV